MAPPYPNPVRSASVISFALSEPAKVDVNVYDVINNGALVRKLLPRQELPAGPHNLPPSARSPPPTSSTSSRGCRRRAAERSCAAFLRKIAAGEYEGLGDVTTLAEPEVVEKLIAQHAEQVSARG
jgi:acetyl-CoA synthetase